MSDSATPLSAPANGKQSPEKIRQPVSDLRPSASNMEPCAKLTPSSVSQVRISAVVGLWSRPSDDAAQANMRFGQVGPGIDENQLSHTANSRARAFRTGSCCALKHFRTS